ncbi:peritrophin-1-like [Colias croceus]|uniref:peritrophin-1-like n=1 Tax=Colias crocea TaxID=72248 RepID=UPI001E27FCBC|nr:peritrophin-1-like [Colias croceus]
MVGTKLLLLALQLLPLLAFEVPKPTADCPRQYGYFPSPSSDCGKYIKCQKGKATETTCPAGLAFNPVIALCDLPANVPSCNPDEVPAPTAYCPSPYGHFPSPSTDCRNYINCQKGKATEMTCPAGLAFNPVTDVCDWPANVLSCNPDDFHGVICPAPEIDENGKPSDFIYKFRQGKSCKRYIACQQGKQRLLSCDDGFSYDDATQSCIDSDLVTDCT